MANLTPVEIEALARKNPLVFGISFVDLLENKQWSIDDRKWIKELYQVCNPFVIEKQPVGQPRKVAFTKSTQAGISTLSLVRMLHFMSYWSVRVGYMLPRQKDTNDFSATRLQPIIEGSAYLKSKLGQPDSVYTKRVGSSYLFLLEGSVEPRSMPMDALFLDEVDLCNPDHVGTAMNRLDASTWQLVTYLSTPTLPNYGIDAVYQSSDMREWIVPCPHCGYKQPLDWEKNLAVIGPANNPEKVYYMCAKCHEEMTLADIQEGTWVAQHPFISEELVGFHISQMMTTPAAKLYMHFRDPNQTLAEFYRKRLGRPYTMQGGSLERDDFLLNCFDEPYEMEFIHDGESTYYMGVDQGNQLQLVVGKLKKNSRRILPVYIEIVPFEKGFDRVKELMRLFKIKRAVIDGDPNRHPIKDLQKEFPSRVLMADYVEQRERYSVKKTGKLTTNVTINRTEGFDDLVAEIKKGAFGLPGNPSSLSPQVETLIDQMTSIKRDIEKRRTPSGEVEVGVWRKLRADHLAHAMLYLKTSVDMDHGNNFKTRTIGNGAAKEEVEEIAEANADYKPDKETITGVIYLLAEVPTEQLVEWLNKHDDAAYEIPFPLSYKMRLSLEKYILEDVLWVLNVMVRQ